MVMDKVYAKVRVQKKVKEVLTLFDKYDLNV